MNGPSYRAELTGLAQPLWARLSLRLHGFMPPNTQMDGWGVAKQEKCGGKRIGEGKEAGDVRLTD